MIAGYQAALARGMDIIVKIDGDGQMDTAILSDFVDPLINGLADYTRGNRFFWPKSIQGMSMLRLIGNAGLSCLTKASSGCWRIMDPTNGYTAIHSVALRTLPLDRLATGTSLSRTCRSASITPARSFSISRWTRGMPARRAAL
jgi:dolichol-phosphate mannosyltransferase